MLNRGLMRQNLSVFYFVSLSLLSSAVIARAYEDIPYSGYYGTTISELKLDSAHLKENLQKIVSGLHQHADKKWDVIVENCPAEANCFNQIVYDYKTARQYLYSVLHFQKDEEGPYIVDAYCQKKFRSQDFIGKKNPAGKIDEVGIFPSQGSEEKPDSTLPNSNVLNCEHTWPQSLFSTEWKPKNEDGSRESKNTDPQKTDFHHLFPASEKMNSTRNNHPFCEVAESVKVECSESKIGYAVFIDGVTPKPKAVEYKSNGRPKLDLTKICFEPPAVHKGRVARAMFYFSTRYKIAIDAVQEYFFRKWNKEYPVDEFEKERNEKIFRIEKVRNPFIDYPELVDLISDF